MPALADLRVRLFADGADLEGISRMAKDPIIKGFTTNPTLMCKASVTNYRAFAQEVLEIVPERPVSFEVFSDDFSEMEKQAVAIAGWGDNVYVKVPVTNTKGQFSGPLIRRLSGSGVKLNVTALMTAAQVAQVAGCLAPGTPACISVFAGRVADTGRDPIPLMKECLERLRSVPECELIWASPRELLNIFQADTIGCHIITLTDAVLSKLPLIGKDLTEYSLETVEMFRQAAVKAALTI